MVGRCASDCATHFGRVFGVSVDVRSRRLACRREFVAAGAAISEAARAEPFGASGETIASATAWAHLEEDGVCDAEPVLRDGEYVADAAVGDAKSPRSITTTTRSRVERGAGLWRLRQTVSVEPGSLHHGSPGTSPASKDAAKEKLRITKRRAAQTPLLRYYVPRAVTLRLADGVVSGAASAAGDASLSEIRQATVLFINLQVADQTPP